MATDPECAICLCELEHEDNIVIICIVCQQPFHRECAEELFNRNVENYNMWGERIPDKCPTCRKSIDRGDISTFRMLRDLLEHRAVKKVMKKINKLSPEEQKKRMEDKIDQILAAERRAAVGKIEEERDSLSKNCKNLFHIEEKLKKRIDGIEAEIERREKNFEEWKKDEKSILCRINEAERQRIITKARREGERIRDKIVAEKTETQRIFLERWRVEVEGFQTRRDKIEEEYHYMLRLHHVMECELKAMKEEFEKRKERGVKGVEPKVVELKGIIKRLEPYFEIKMAPRFGYSRGRAKIEYDEYMDIGQARKIFKELQDY